MPVLAAGRMWWFGRDRIWGSISDGYSSYDLDYEGDAGPIIRSFGSGPVAYVNWALALDGIVIGREMSVDIVALQRPERGDHADHVPGAGTSPRMARRGCPP